MPENQNKSVNTARVEYFATGYTREELKIMHPRIDLEPEWVKCPQCKRENSKETWAKFENKCPNCLGLLEKEGSNS